jgi:hypothetical protein
MSPLNRFTLTIKDPKIRSLYNQTFDKKVLHTLILLTFVRLLWLVFQTILMHTTTSGKLLLFKFCLYNYPITGLQLMLVPLQKYFPKQMNFYAVPIFMIMSAIPTAAYIPTVTTMTYTLG